MQGTDSLPNTPPPEYKSAANPSLRTRSPSPDRFFHNETSVDESNSSMDVTFMFQPPDYSSALTDPPPDYLSSPHIVLHDETGEMERSGDLQAGSICLTRVKKYTVTGDVIAYEDVVVKDTCHFRIQGDAIFRDDLRISSNSILEVDGDAMFKGSVFLYDIARLIVRGMATFENQLTARKLSTCVVLSESHFNAVTTLRESVVYFMDGNAKFQIEPKIGQGCNIKGLDSQEQLEIKVGRILPTMTVQ